MPVRNDREYRSLIEMRAVDDENYIVEGYATTFNDPYLMYEWEGVQYFEEIDRGAFADCDMTDVLFLYNHEGRVFARIKNGTLTVIIDEKGIKVRADLSKTELARQMYEDIKAGMVDQMSWAFTVKEDAYDRETHTRKILKVRKMYDVSAVSIPANPNTSISARSFFDGVIEKEKAERLERARLKLKTFL